MKNIIQVIHAKKHGVFLTSISKEEVEKIKGTKDQKSNIIIEGTLKSRYIGKYAIDTDFVKTIKVSHCILAGEKGNEHAAIKAALKSHVYYSETNDMIKHVSGNLLTANGGSITESKYDGLVLHEEYVKRLDIKEGEYWMYFYE